MGFFQSLKDDLSEAVDGILGEEEEIDETAAGADDKSDPAADKGEPDPFDGMGVSFEQLLNELKEQNFNEDDDSKDIASAEEDEDEDPVPEDDYNGEDIAALLGMASADLSDTGSDEDYVPATPEEIAEFEASGEDEEQDGGTLDMADLDKLMADISAMQEAEVP